MRDTFVFFLQYLCFIISFLYGISFFGDALWFCDVLSSFKLQYFVSLLFLASFGFVIKRSWWFLLYLGIACLILIEIQPWFGTENSVVVSSEIDVAGINLLSTNDSAQLTVNLVEEKKPDVIVFTEYTPNWETALSDLHTSYPYRLERPRKGNFGIALFSKHPLQLDSIYQFAKGKYTSPFVEIEINDKRIGILGTHPEPPFNKRSSTLRNNHLKNITSSFKSYQGPLVIIGDFNCTPYSVHFKNLLKGLQLSDSRIRFGFLNSWPSTFFPFLIPIDHCLVNSKCKVIERYNGPNIGSDHYPIFCKVGF